MRNTSLVLLFIAEFGLLLGVAACGVADDAERLTQDTTATEKDVNSGEESTTPDIITDLDLAGEDISSHTDDIVSSIINLDNDTSATLSFESDASSEDGEKQDRSCTVGDSSTVVEINRSRSMNKSLTKDDRSLSVSMERNSNITRTFSKTDSSGTAISIPCDEKKTHIKLTAADFAGVKLAASFKHYFAQSHLVTREGVTKSFNRSRTSEGTRTVEWSAATVSDGIVTMTKKVGLNIEKSFTRLDKNGTDKQATATVATAAEAPLIVEVTRNAGSRKWLTRTLTGTITATGKDGGIVSVTYAAASWTREGECTPTSGTITGSISKKDETTASRTFTVDLAAGTKTITFDDNSTQDFDIEGCAFARPSHTDIFQVNKGKGTMRGPMKRKVKKGSDETIEEKTATGKTP